MSRIRRDKKTDERDVIRAIRQFVSFVFTLLAVTTLLLYVAPAAPLAASQITRGSKDSAASIVRTTTAAKKGRPGPGSTDMSG